MANPHGRNTSRICEELVAYECEARNLHPYKPIFDTGVDFIIYHPEKTKNKFSRIQVKTACQKERWFSIKGKNSWEDKVREVDYFIFVYLAPRNKSNGTTKDNSKLFHHNTWAEFWIFDSATVCKIGKEMIKAEADNIKKKRAKSKSESESESSKLEFNLDWEFGGKKFTTIYQKHKNNWDLLT